MDLQLERPGPAGWAPLRVQAVELVRRAVLEVLHTAEGARA